MRWGWLVAVVDVPVRGGLHGGPEDASGGDLPVGSQLEGGGWLGAAAGVWETAVVSGARGSYGHRWVDAARHPARRDGAVLWALLALPWVAGLVLARRHHLDAGGWAVVLTVSLGLPTLWVTWATFRDARRSGAAESGPGLPRIADELAAAVGRQWGKEAAVRRLNDPYPLPVSWAAADGLAAPWESLTELAASGAGWLAPAPGRVWAAGPDELAGEGGEFAGVLAKVPTGRLVVLGEPGSGKTMLMVRQGSGADSRPRSGPGAGQSYPHVVCR